MTKFTYSFDEDNLDHTDNHFDTLAEAYDHACQTMSVQWSEDGEYGSRTADVWISELRIRNNDENEILNTEHREISSFVARPRSDRDEHFAQGDYI